MTQGGFQNGAAIFMNLWRNQVTDGGSKPPETIGDFVEGLTKNPTHMYNSLNRATGGDPNWKEGVTGAYNNVVQALKDPGCQPECPPAGGR